MAVGERLSPPDKLKQEHTTIRDVGRWYDKIMYIPESDKRYGGSDFWNYGYWEPATRTLSEACQNLMERLLAFIPKKEGTILDVACGKGATTRHLLNYYRPEDVVGINISKKQLETCKINAPGCKFLLMDATELAFKDNCFDNIICVEAALHFNTREEFLRQALRILKPRGRLVLSDVLRTTNINQASPLIPAKNYVRTPAEYRAICLRAGFEQVQILDRTRQCWGEFYRHSVLYLRNKLVHGGINELTFRQRMGSLAEKRATIGYYVLVSASKAELH